MLAACGDPGPAGGDTAACGTPEAPVATDVASAAMLRVGEIEVCLAGGGGEFECSSGSELAGIFPPGDHWSYLGAVAQWSLEITEVGDCELRRYQPSFCDPPCASGVCTADSTCAPYPETLDAGAVESGALLSSADGNNFFGPVYAARGAPGLLVTGRDQVTCVEGGELPGFVAAAPAPAPLGIEVPAEGLDLEPGAPLNLSWTPAGDDSRVRIELVNDNRSHGLPAELVVRCEAPDAAGSLTVPAELVSEVALIEGSEPRAVVCAGTDCLLSRLARIRSTAVDGGQLAVTYEVFRERRFYPY